MTERQMLRCAQNDKPLFHGSPIQSALSSHSGKRKKRGNGVKQLPASAAPTQWLTGFTPGERVAPRVEGGRAARPVGRTLQGVLASAPRAVVWPQWGHSTTPWRPATIFASESAKPRRQCTQRSLISDAGRLATRRTSGTAFFCLCRTKKTAPAARTTHISATIALFIVPEPLVF